MRISLKLKFHNLHNGGVLHALKVAHNVYYYSTFSTRHDQLKLFTVQPTTALQRLSVKPLILMHFVDVVFQNLFTGGGGGPQVSFTCKGIKWVISQAKRKQITFELWLNAVRR